MNTAHDFLPVDRQVAYFSCDRLGQGKVGAFAARPARLEGINGLKSMYLSVY